MPSVSMKINTKAFGRKFNRMLDIEKFKKAAYELMEPVFEDARIEFFNKFEESNITQEILAGPTAANISETLGGYGNLYSFIGFEAQEDNPIISLRGFLQNSLELKQTIRRERNWYFRIKYPSLREIEEVTPMPWEEGNSWVDGIEHGISNLSHYMYKHWTPGRSQEAFQLPYENNEDLTFSSDKYLSEMLADFREKFNKLK